MNFREYAVLLPLVFLAFWIGIYPKPFFAYIDHPVEKIVHQVNPDFYKQNRSQLAAVPVSVPQKPSTSTPSAPAAREDK